MNQNMPTMATSTYASQAYDGAAMANGLGLAQQKGFAGIAGAGQLANIGNQALGNLQPPKGNIMPARRLVQVVIVDPNENVSLEDCMLFKGDEKLTDATDQELFFELDIKNILEIHNAKRIKVIDKKVKDRTEYLEPAKIRDLKMVVVSIATF